MDGLAPGDIWSQLLRYPIGDPPVTEPRIPGLGSQEGKFTSRDAVLLQIEMSFGSL